MVGALATVMVAVGLFNSSGTLKWTFVSGGATQFSSPVIGGDGRIFIGAGYNAPNENVYAINPVGSESWEAPTGEIFQFA